MPSSTKTPCTPSPPAGGPAAPGAAGAARPPRKRSRNGPRRAVVLLLVHVAIVLHVVYWLNKGSAVSPLEPSEGMEFAKQGVINAGFVFFAIMIVSTLVFGRFFCGWGCHLIALQDGCRWLLGRIGIRPKPFRSRVLLLVPLGAFYYLFLHPFVQRWMRDLGWEYLGTELVREEFWATFPPWHVAIFTFLVTGFAIVYFLGSKGFCAYACPYGGIFGVVDKIAPGRIRVTDACEGCGHCTAACTSNVLVHKEVRDFRMVVDPGCMKCMDCVSVCPNDALYFGFGKPAVGVGHAGGVKPPPRAYSWKEELALGVFFFAALLSFRGLFGVVPLLLALAIAGILAYLSMQVARLFYKRSVSIQSQVLKSGGQWRAGGYSFCVGMLAFGVFWAWSGWLQFHRHAANRGFRELHDVVFELRSRWFEPGGADLGEEERALVERTARHAARLPDWALPKMSHFYAEQAWLALLQGDREEFELRLDRAIELRPRDPDLRLDRARLLAATGRADQAEAVLTELLEREPRAAAARVEIARMRAARGDVQGAAAVLEAGLALDASEPVLHFNLGVVCAVGGRPDLALERFRAAIDLDPGYREARGNLAGMLCQLGRFREGIAELEYVVAEDPGDVDAYAMMARAHLELSEPEQARQRLEAGLEAVPEAAGLHAFLVDVCRRLGDEEGARYHAERAAELSAVPGGGD